MLPLLNAGSKSDFINFQEFFNERIKTKSFDPEMELIYDSLQLEKRGL